MDHSNLGSDSLVLDLAGGVDGWVQRLAGGSLWCDRRLAPWAVAAARPSGPSILVREATDQQPIYDGPGLLEGRLQRVRVAPGLGGGYVVELDDGERFSVAAGGVAREASAGGPQSVATTVERALGPPLALALALRDVHLLHASALRGSRGVVALTAPSGGGKSTLAGAAAAHAGLGLARVADDQLPVRLSDAAVALPHYPQLKLPADEWYAESQPEALPLVALVEIELGGAVAPGLPVETERLGPAEACVALARATVATRLFDAGLLARHLDRCAAAARGLEVYRLRYRSGLERISDALVALATLACSA